MTVYDTYGVLSDDLEAARTKIEEILGVNMEGHESSFKGEYYRYGSRGQENFTLRSNYDPFEDEWDQSAFTQYPFILYVSETERAEELERLFAKKSVQRIKHSVL